LNIPLQVYNLRKIIINYGNNMRALLVFLFFSFFPSASDYSKRGYFKKWVLVNKTVGQRMKRHKNYNRFDHLYIHFSKMWNRKFANEKNSKYKGMYITPYILKALTWKESRWIPNRHNKGLNRNKSIDYGLAQVNNRSDEKFFRRANVKRTQADLYNPKKNLAVAMHIFHYHARAEIRNGRNNEKDKMIYWLNSYNGKATYNPTAYGESVLYLARILKNMNGISEYTSLYDVQENEEDGLEELYANIAYKNTPTHYIYSNKNHAEESSSDLYGDMYDYKPYFGY